MYREDDIRSVIQPWIDKLYELYESTDPSRGQDSEIEKLARAQVAVNLSWHVFGRLLLWAQSQIVGYEIFKRQPGVADVLKTRRGKDLDRDSHELELLGMSYAWSLRQNIDDDEYRKFLDTLNECERLLDVAALRSSIVRLLLSDNANTLFWRLPLIHALEALNAGEVDPLFHPERKGRRGKAYRLDGLRAMAIQHVYFLVGCGEKKHVALKNVANKLNVEVETIRTWEKNLKREERWAGLWKAARVAGRYKEDIEKSDLPFNLESFGFVNILEMADYFLKVKDFCSLDEIRAQLLELQRSEDANAGSI
jgi:hypothetical protein